MEEDSLEARYRLWDELKLYLPKRVVTANRIVGYNMAYFRKAAGLTQEQLGVRLGGWNKVAVSAAERSWDGRRVRKFDADEIVQIAQALDIPLAALFLPPEDDGDDERYVIEGLNYFGGTSMRNLVEFALSDPTESDHPAMQAYEQRLVSAVNKYLDSQVAEVVATRLKERATEEQLAKALREARQSRAALEGFRRTLSELFSDNNLLQTVLVTMLKATPEGQALIEKEERRERTERGEATPEDDELTPAERRIAWEGIPEAERDWQANLVAIGAELFGERGPAMRNEIDQVITEARRRGFDGPDGARVLLRHDGTYELVKPPEPGEDSQ